MTSTEVQGIRHCITDVAGSARPSRATATSCAHTVSVETASVFLLSFFFSVSGVIGGRWGYVTHGESSAVVDVSFERLGPALGYLLSTRLCIGTRILTHKARERTYTITRTL